MTFDKKAILGAFNVSRSVRLVWQAGRLLAVATIFLMACVGTLPLAGLWVVKLIVDTVTAVGGSGGGFVTVLPLVGLAAILALANVVVNAIYGWVQAYQSQLISERVISELHQKAIGLDLSFFENSEFYDTLHRAMAEGPYRPTNIIRHLSQLGQNGVAVVAVVGLLASLHWWLGGVLLLAVIPGAAVNLKFSRTLFKWQATRTQIERQSDYLNWLLTRDVHAKEIRLFRLGAFFSRQSADIRARLRKEQLNLKGRQLVAQSLAQTLATAAIFACMGWVVFQTVQGAITVGSLVMYAGAFQRGGTYLKGGLAALAGIYEDNLFLRHYHQMMAIEPQVASPAQALELPQPVTKGLCVKSVSFSYPNSTQRVLEDVDLTIRVGHVTALVGPNGSGKTTLTKLICRLYDPDQGDLSIDGVDIRRLNVDQWRNQISVIFQDFARYHFPVSDNIGVGDIDVRKDSERVMQAALLAGADGFIEALPQGYDTWLGKWFHDGVELSTGQWQKIALARAFLRESQFLILDEPTSSLDAESEAALFESFKQALMGRTGVLISHRFSTISMADYIYVLDAGRIAEHGTHAALLNKHGLYARMYRAQAAHYQN